MGIPKDHEDRVREALEKHETSFLYAYVFNEETPGDKEGLMDFVVDEMKRHNDGGDKEKASKILLSVVHSGVTPGEMGIAIYERGLADSPVGGVE